MSENKTKDMTMGSPLKLILTFAFPLLLGNLFQQAYNMADAAIVGQTLGSDCLAAVGSTSSVQFLVLGFCIGSCTGFAIPVAQRFGARDESTMRKFIFNGAILTTVIAIIITTLTCLLTTNILNILQVPENIFNDSYAYIFVIFAGIPFTLLYNYLSAILRAIGNSKTPFLFLAFSSILNIFLDFFCILNLGWGCAGAAIATIFSQAVSGVLCFVLILKKIKILHIQKEECVIDKDILKNLLAMGIPTGLQFSITAIGSMVMQSANNALGSVYVSGFTAGLKIKQFIMCPFDALATGVSTFASQNYGALQDKRIKEGVRVGILVGLAYGVIGGIILIIFGRNLSLLFLSADYTAQLDASALYLRRMGYCWWLLAILNVMRMVIQGLGFAGRAVFAGVVEMIMRSIVALGFAPKFGFDAITWADQCAWAGACIYMVPMYLLCIKHISERINAEKNLRTVSE